MKCFPASCVALLFVLITSATFAQAKPVALGPDALVEKLYKVNETDDSPFFQAKNRAIVDRFFMKDLADLIWKDAVTAKGDLGALDYNPLYGSQDPQITEFKIVPTGLAADAKISPGQKVIVRTTFRDSGKKASASFVFDQDSAGVWKISNITYPDGPSLRKTLDGTALREASN
jgi:hypothetical protein